MGIGLPQKFQILGIAVVGMAVGKEQRLHLAQIQAVKKAVHMVFRRQIQQQVIIDQGLGPGADVLSAQGSGLFAQFTAAEYPGPGFSGGSAVIGNFHTVLRCTANIWVPNGRTEKAAESAVASPWGLRNRSTGVRSVPGTENTLSRASPVRSRRAV